MSSVKNAVTAASKTQFINIPRINTSGSYRDWLSKLLDVPHNQHVLSGSKKKVVDGYFQRQAAEQFKLDDKKLKKALDDVSLAFPVSQKPAEAFSQMASKRSEESFGKNRSALQAASKSLEYAELTSKLSVPRIADDPRVRDQQIWKTVTYGRFVERMERANPHTVLTKDIVDAAFHVAVSRTDSWASGLRAREKAVTRVSPHIHIAATKQQLTTSVLRQTVYQLLER